MTAPTPEDVPQPPPYQGVYGGPPYAAQPYDPAYGYGPPGVEQFPQPQPVRGSNEVTMAVLAYALGMVVGWLGPLIIYATKKNESPYVRYHAAQALNSYLTYLITIFSTFIPVTVVAISVRSGIPILFAVAAVAGLAIAHFVFNIIALIRASRGEYFRLPTILCFRMVR